MAPKQPRTSSKGRCFSEDLKLRRSGEPTHSACSAQKSLTCPSASEPPLLSLPKSLRVTYQIDSYPYSLAVITSPKPLLCLACLLGYTLSARGLKSHLDKYPAGRSLLLKVGRLTKPNSSGVGPAIPALGLNPS